MVRHSSKVTLLLVVVLAGCGPGTGLSCTCVTAFTRPARCQQHTALVVGMMRRQKCSCVKEGWDRCVGHCLSFTVLLVCVAGSFAALVTRCTGICVGHNCQLTASSPQHWCWEYTAAGMWLWGRCFVTVHTFTAERCSPQPQPLETPCIALAPDRGAWGEPCKHVVAGGQYIR